MSVVKTIKVNIEGRLETRQIALCVQLASSFSTEDIKVDYDGKSISAKSLMGAINLAAPEGAEFVVTANGPQAEAAVQAIEDFLNGGK